MTDHVTQPRVRYDHTKALRSAMHALEDLPDNGRRQPVTPPALLVAADSIPEVAPCSKVATAPHAQAAPATRAWILLRLDNRGPVAHRLASRRSQPADPQSLDRVGGSLPRTGAAPGGCPRVTTSARY